MDLTKPKQQRFLGVGFATLILSLWAGAVYYAWFFHDWQNWGLDLILLPALVFLFTGLFITSHEAMHGLVAPGQPRVNRCFGRLAMFLYAGFSYDHFLPLHHDHHRFTAAKGDPDFHDGQRTNFWSWYLHFMGQHISPRPFILYTVIFIATWFANGPLVGFVLAWPLPALVSSVQLFYFGTYLPHSEPTNGYNELKSRSNAYPEWLSFLTCYHFGYHFEHHRWPGVPWWKLPSVRRTFLREN